MIKILSENNLKTIVRENLGLTRRHLKLSKTEIQVILQQDFPGVKVVSSEGFPVGGPNELYHVFLENPDRELVIKIINKGAESGHDGYCCARESFALKHASTSSSSFQSLFASHPDGGNLGRPYLVMNCIKGQPLWLNYWEKTGDVSHRDLERIGRNVGKAIRNLHKVVFEKHGDLPIAWQNNPKPHYYPTIWGMSGDLKEVFMKRVDFILTLYNRHEVLSLMDCRSIKEFFQRKTGDLLSSELSPSLIHGDLDKKNILITKTEGKWHFSGLADFDKSLALPIEAELGFMESRWTTNTSEESLRIYSHFRQGFMEGYQIDGILPNGWELRAKLFFALQSLERIYIEGSSNHLRHYIGSV